VAVNILKTLIVLFFSMTLFNVG